MSLTNFPVKVAKLEAYLSSLFLSLTLFPLSISVEKSLFILFYDNRKIERTLKRFIFGVYFHDQERLQISLKLRPWIGLFFKDHYILIE